jgi:hypothetical protein
MMVSTVADSIIVAVVVAPVADSVVVQVVPVVSVMAAMPAIGDGCPRPSPHDVSVRPDRSPLGDHASGRTRGWGEEEARRQKCADAKGYGASNGVCYH